MFDARYGLTASLSWVFVICDIRLLSVAVSAVVPYPRGSVLTSILCHHLSLSSELSISFHLWPSPKFPSPSSGSVPLSELRSATPHSYSPPAPPPHPQPCPKLIHSPRSQSSIHSNNRRNTEIAEYIARSCSMYTQSVSLSIQAMCLNFPYF